jgi:tetrahydromethanopterin S-methyltransferase subunit G
MPEVEITVDEVEQEHLQRVHQGAQWAYLFGVIAIGLIAMLLLIALMGAAD